MQEEMGNKRKKNSIIEKENKSGEIVATEI